MTRKMYLKHELKCWKRFSHVNDYERHVPLYVVKNSSPAGLATFSLIFINSKMKSCRMIDDVIILDMTWEDTLWQMLGCCGLTFF